MLSGVPRTVSIAGRGSPVALGLAEEGVILPPGVPRTVNITDQGSSAGLGVGIGTGLGIPPGLRVRVYTGQGAGQTLTTRDPMTPEPQIRVRDVSQTRT